MSVVSFSNKEKKVVEIFQGLTNLKPKLIPNIKVKDGQHILTNNKITGDKPSKQLFPKEVATQLPLLN